MTDSEIGPDKNERAMARRAVGGDDGAWADLVDSHWNRAFQLHALATDDPRAARMLGEATFEAARKELDGFLRDDEPFSRWLAALCRDTARRRLSEDDWNATPWAQGTDILSDPPLAKPLPHDALHKGAHVPEDAIRKATLGLSLGHKLFARLFFVEGFPLGRLAGVLSASSAFVSSFVYGLMDQLGGLETLEFEGEDGPAGISLATDTLEARDDHDAIKELLRSHAACEGSRTLIFRVIRLAEALSRDPLPATEAPKELLAALRAGPDTAQAGEDGEKGEEKARKPPPKIIPLSHKPEVRGRQDRWLHWAFAATILLFFTGGTYALFGGKAFQSRRPVVAARDVEEKAVDEKRMVGYYATLSGRRHVLAAGKTLHASPLGATAVTFLDGPRALLLAGGGMLGYPGRAQLMSGKMIVYADDLKRKKNGRFDVQAGGLQVTVTRGTLSVATAPGQGSMVAIKGGSATVRLPDGSTVDLDPFRQVRVGPDGKYRVVDAGPETFSERPDPAYAGSGTSRIAGAGALTGGAGGPARPGGRYRIAGGARAGGAGATGYGTGVGGSSRGSGGGSSGSTGKGGGVRRGVMLPGNRVRPGTVRGFRDAF